MFESIWYQTKSQVQKEICPYCFEYFHIKDTPFRCTSPASKCAPEVDKVFQDIWSDSRPIGKVLKPSGEFSDRFKDSIRCGDCGHISHKRICPHCHMELPHTTGKYKNHIYAVIGGANAGKSHYIAVLIDQIKRRIGPNMGLLLSAEDDFTIDRYTKVFYKPIFENGGVIDKTKSATTDTDVQKPLVYSIRITKDTLFEKNKVVKYLTLVFFDTAGEDLNSEDTMSTVNKYIYRSDGIILLIDPLQLPLVRKQLPTGTPMPKMISANASDVLNRTTHLIQKGLGLKPAEKIKIPLAVAFTKFDAVEPIIKDTQLQINNNANHDKGFDADDFEAVNSEMISLLSEWGGEDIVQLAQTRFSKYAFFGLSALGCNPHNTSKIPRVVPHRVEDPFLWLLSNNKIVNKVKHHG